MMGLQPAQPEILPAVAISVPSALLHAKPSCQASNTMLAATIKDSLRSDAIPGEQPPRTADQFSEKFKEVDNMIDAFMKKYDSGQLVRLGWDPSELPG